MKKIICYFRGHKWSQWYPWITFGKHYRYCSVCGKAQLGDMLLGVRDMTPEEMHGQRSNMSRLRNIFNWLISLTKPSFRDSIDEAVKEGQQQWFNRIPRDVLNDGIKCLANELSKKDFDSLGLSLVSCGYCRNRNFCGDIIHSMEKAFKKYERKEKVQKSG